MYYSDRRTVDANNVLRLAGCDIELRMLNALAMNRVSLRDVMMTDTPDQRLADECLKRAAADIEAWLELLENGQLATVAPFGQMFIYQLRTGGKLADKTFAVEELYRLYYRRAGGKGDPPAIQTDGAR